MTENYDEVRPDVAERNAAVLKEVEALDAPDPHAEVEALDESDMAGTQELPGAIIDDELVVEVRPPAGHEFVCDHCFVVRHPSMLSDHDHSQNICHECAAEGL